MASNTPRNFTAVARLLRGHIRDIEERCIKLEQQCCSEGDLFSVMKGATSGRAGASSEQGHDVITAAARWWWNEYTSVKDGIMSLIDGKIRHEYDRPKAERTPNDQGIHWQKASLRTGESQDNLRRLLKKAGSKHESEFDAINLRIEDLQESIKRIRESLVRAVRGVRVNKFGEETQELRLKPRGGGKELRLLPPCGSRLEECVCGASSSPPKPVSDGSLAAAIRTAREAAIEAAEEQEPEQGPPSSRNNDVRRMSRSNVTGAAGDDDDNDDDDSDVPYVHSTGPREAKRRRVVVDEDGGGGKKSSDTYGYHQKELDAPRVRRPAAARTEPASASDVPLDEIKRQMGKNPLELRRRKDALDDETRAAGGRGRPNGDRPGGTCVSADKDNSEKKNAGMEKKPPPPPQGSRGGASGAPGVRGRGGSAGVGTEDEEEEEAEDEEGWRDDLIGMQPHEKAEAYERRNMFREALRWHREDLVAARARAQDGEEEDERESSLDLARALRNTGRCLGRLGNSGFAESKKCLAEARELVGPDGPSPCPVEEQDVVLELGNLWYSRYLLYDGQGVRFLAVEALGDALRYYRESRELCVDLMADSGEDADGDEGVGMGYDSAAAAAAACTASRGCLMRAEYNVGMSLLEQEEHEGAARHLSAAVSIFRDVFTGVRSEDEKDPPKVGGVEGGGGGGGGAKESMTRGSRLEVETSSALSVWKAAVPEQEELADLGGVYASSLSLLGECLAAGVPYSSTRATSAGSGIRRPTEETLAESVEAFLDMEDASRAVNALLKLVEILHRSSACDGDDEDDCQAGFLSRVEAICERASLLVLPSAEEKAGACDGLEDERAELQQVREKMAEIRARRKTKGGAGNKSPDRSGHERNELVGDRQRRSSTETRDDTSLPPLCSANAATPLRRVGPQPTSGFAKRRRRLRAAAAAAAATGGGTRTVLGAIWSNNVAPRHQRTPRAVVAGASVAPNLASGGPTTRLPTGSASSSLGVACDGHVAGPIKKEDWLTRWGRGSFAALRAASSVAAADGPPVPASPTAASRGVMSTRGEGGDPEETAEGKGSRRRRRRQTALDLAYRAKCHDLQQEANPGVSARLAQVDRDLDLTSPASPPAVSTCGETDYDADADDHLSFLPRSQARHPHPTLDLSYCRLTDRELRVLLHVLCRECLDDRGTAEVAAADGGAMAAAIATRSPYPTPSILRELVLAGNPGIGAGGLGALWDGGSGVWTKYGLFSSLLRLDLSRCGLTAVDLAGLSPGNRHEGGGGGRDGFLSSSSRRASSTICLRALVLRDNPLARVKEGDSGPGGAQGCWVEPACKGVDALRDLIAGAPGLEELDVSGCSQIPDGPARRLYSPRVSDLLVSALSDGLESRISCEFSTAAAAVAGAEFVAGGVNDGGGCRDGRAQVLALRVGNNRFFQSSWRRLFERLSSHPPRELDLSFASVLPLCSSATTSPVAGDAAGQTGVEGQGIQSCGSDSPLFPSFSQQVREQSLGELLASTILPADAPGVEVLNLTGSTGLLLEHHPRQHEEAEADQGRAGPAGEFPATSPASPSPTDALLMLLRDALMSPLCRTTHLLLSGVRGLPPPTLRRPESAAPAAASHHNTPPALGSARLRVFRPQHVKSLLEAASACTSLKCLDLAGSDLSGPAGADAAASAVASLIRNGGGGGGGDGGRFVGASGAVEEEEGDTGLRRLSLRACGLGMYGLAKVIRAVIAVLGDDRRTLGMVVPRIEAPPSRPPRVLDLSENACPTAPIDAVTVAAVSAVVGAEGRETGGEMAGQAAGLGSGRVAVEEGNAAAAELSELVTSVRALESLAHVTVAVSLSSRQPPQRSRASPSSSSPPCSREPALIDLSGNHLGFLCGAG